MQEDFQKFYHETFLEEEVNTDLLYKVQRELRGYAIYDEHDIDALCDVYFADGAQGSDVQGKLTSKLIPAVGRYNAKSDDDRYQIRRSMRSFCKWYRYVSQVVRMFDQEMHREFIYCSFLVGVLPEQPMPMEDIEKLLQLEMYKLEKTFEGDISLGNETGVYAPAKPKGSAKPEEKDPLDEIIARINEQYKGNFTEAHRVIVNGIIGALRSDKRLENMARSSDPRIFAESIYPQVFSDAAQKSYMESQETYRALFEDRNLYKTIESITADVLYREMRGADGK